MADIAAWRLCLGCGACAYICPDQRVRLQDVPTEGIRPVVAPGPCGDCRDCLEICPAYSLDRSRLLSQPDLQTELIPGFGPVLEAWEGFATDQEIRYAGASGGAITALALFGLDQSGMHGVLHIGADPQQPLRNLTKLSRNRADLLSNTGSRYAPASACDRLSWIESAPGPCLFIGQPSEVSALAKARRLRPRLSKNVALTISFFCAGSPSSSATAELLQKLRIDPAEVEQIRYRGLGWPGMFAVRKRGSTEYTPLQSYQESWGFLQKYRPYSVHLCPDSSGEDADISCGDPWYRQISPGEPGRSIVLARTQRGSDFIRRALAAGYLHLEPVEASKVNASQKNFISKKGAVWGRIAALKCLGLPTPRLTGGRLFREWLGLPLKQKLKSTLGTARRAFQRGYFRPLPPPS